MNDERRTRGERRRLKVGGTMGDERVFSRLMRFLVHRSSFIVHRLASKVHLSSFIVWLLVTASAGAQTVRITEKPEGLVHGMVDVPIVATEPVERVALFI